MSLFLVHRTVHVFCRLAVCSVSIWVIYFGLYVVDTSRFNESADWNSFVLACIGGHSAVCTWPVCLMA